MMGGFCTGIHADLNCIAQRLSPLGGLACGTDSGVPSRSGEEAGRVTRRGQAGVAVWTPVRTSGEGTTHTWLLTWNLETYWVNCGL